MAKTSSVSVVLSAALVCLCLFLFCDILKTNIRIQSSQPIHAGLLVSASKRADIPPEVSAIERRRLLLVSIYRAETGVREKSGRNDGKRVEEYLKYTGLSRGNPWCAAFVCWSLGRAGIENPRSAYSPVLFKKQKIIWKRGGNAPGAKYRQPKGGDVFGIYFPEKKRIAHAGFVDQWQESLVITVEGNTNNEGSREGDGVYRKRRPIQSLYLVARWWAN